MAREAVTIQEVRSPVGEQNAEAAGNEQRRQVNAADGEFARDTVHENCSSRQWDQLITCAAPA